jgi:hypothetical protein
MNYIKEYESSLKSPISRPSNKSKALKGSPGGETSPVVTKAPDNSLVYETHGGSSYYDLQSRTSSEMRILNSNFAQNVLPFKMRIDSTQIESSGPQALKESTSFNINHGANLYDRVKELANFESLNSMKTELYSNLTAIPSEHGFISNKIESGND